MEAHKVPTVTLTPENFIVITNAIFTLSDMVDNDPRADTPEATPFHGAINRAEAVELGQTLFDMGGFSLLNCVIFAMVARHGEAGKQLKPLWEESLTMARGARGGGAPGSSIAPPSRANRF
jgi:hypothetical protein